MRHLLSFPSLRHARFLVHISYLYLLEESIIPYVRGSYIFSVNSTLETLISITAWRKKLELEWSSSNQCMLQKCWLLFTLYENQHR
ncbi:hypothetical protein NC653_028802 [Populus alba x Populus x berolinensis]|uniref:Uncharacterized protein n=1 Tax=Populus alba x Populus x berolinensis TaxID=444605 RepID=A0AAD6M0M0_9ROSI|nr:hypothetical protein NC653_028802 [Populus alba x Populus x berolinensis]